MDEYAPSKYILACDERGTTRWPSPSKTWAIGGCIVELEKHQVLVSAWEEIKLQLCGSRHRELKWSHFFPGRHQDGVDNPLISNDPRKWREQAAWALSGLFGAADLVPVNTVMRKDRASGVTFITTEDGRGVLDINTFWVGVLGQFALFLEEHKATGEVWFDQLGSRAEEIRKQADWQQLRDGEWAGKSERQTMLKRIAPNLKFLDSQTEPFVQIADFVSGVIWAASEGDEEFLLRTLRQYFPKGLHTYTLFHVE